MIRTTVIIVFWLLAMNVNGQSMDSCFLNYEVSKIPNDVKQEIKRFYKKRFVLANPKEKFQATDVIEKRNLKERRLVFWTQCSDEFIIIYEHGGYAYHRHLMVLRNERGQWKVARNIGAGKVKSIDQIKEQLKDESVVSFDHF
jgi:hypothetical protein